MFITFADIADIADIDAYTHKHINMGILCLAMYMCIHMSMCVCAHIFRLQRVVVS